jgi:hypothetical protein
MGYAPPALRRRSRRRRTLLILIILAALFGLIALALRYRTDERIAVDYFDATKLLADDQVVVADSLEGIFVEIGDLERPVILERIVELAAEVGRLRSELTDVEVTAAVAEPHGYLTVAFGSWDDGLSLLEGAVIEVLDGEDAATGDAALRAAYDLLRVGDRAYFGFQDSLTRVDQELVGQEYPRVSYVGGERAALYVADVIASRLRGIFKLEGEDDIALSVTIEPEPLVQEGQIPVVPNAELFLVNLVVSNEGNLAESRILVSLVGDPQSEDLEQVMLRSIVPSLEPGESTTVTFDVSDLIVPGEIYELRALAQIRQDDSPENNSWMLVLIRNSE